MEKAAVIDKHEPVVWAELKRLVSDPSSWMEIRAVARGRHILGSYEYGDTNLFEWSNGKVRAAVLEELADAVVYLAWLEERAAEA